jgi:hypothetical protein
MVVCMERRLVVISFVVGKAFVNNSVHKSMYKGYFIHTFPSSNT